MELPEGARMLSDLPPMATLGEDREWSFRPTWVVAAERQGGGATLLDWTDSGLHSQSDQLAGFTFLDRAEDDSSPCVRTLAHHSRGQHSLTLEQWWLAASDRYWVLSASCATLDYHRLAEAFEAVARSFRPGSA